jgi:hypothetical protein
MPRPLQVYLDDAELERLENWSKGRGWSKSQAVRVAVRALVRSSESGGVLSLSGMIEGLPPDLAENMDRYLSESFVANATPNAKPSGPGPRKRLRRQ